MTELGEGVFEQSQAPSDAVDDRISKFCRKLLGERIEHDLDCRFRAFRQFSAYLVNH